MSGNVWIYPELAHYLIKNLKKNESRNDHVLDVLSKHEKECTLLVAQGSSNKEIANLLDLQEITIKKHLSSVYKKLGFKNRMELALFVNLDPKS
jgi:DNA-binding NarL/FixJ family response regulator